MGVGYDQTNDTILIIGGDANQQGLALFKDSAFTDEGANYLTDTTIGNDMYKNKAQGYTQLNHILWLLDLSGYNIMRVNTETRAVMYPANTILPQTVGFFDGFGCLTSYQTGNHQYLLVVGGLDRPGSTTISLDLVQVHNITAGTWMTAGSIPNMQESRYSLTCAVHGNVLYAIGGLAVGFGFDFIESEYFDFGNDFIESGTNQWHYIDGTITGHVRPRSAVYGNNIFVIPGSDQQSGGNYFDDVHVIDTVTKSVSIQGTLALAVFQPGIIVVNNVLYIFGGDKWDPLLGYGVPINTYQYINLLSDAPTQAPSENPSRTPTKVPSSNPTTINPTEFPTKFPTKYPTKYPSSSPTKYPTNFPTTTPTQNPTQSPSKFPTASPSKYPTTQPTASPSKQPSQFPTTSPSKYPTANPSKNPSATPTQSPSNNPSATPTDTPTEPTSIPSESPTLTLPTSDNPTTTPSQYPSQTPSKFPTLFPTVSPSKYPTTQPSKFPSQSPSFNPSTTPSKYPTLTPTETPSKYPTNIPTNSPTEPTSVPSETPTLTIPTTTQPSAAPTKQPSQFPSVNPSVTPTDSPTQPSLDPTESPVLTTSNPTISIATEGGSGIVQSETIDSNGGGQKNIDDTLSFLQKNLLLLILGGIVCIVCCVVCFIAMHFKKKKRKVFHKDTDQMELTRITSTSEVANIEPLSTSPTITATMTALATSEPEPEPEQEPFSNHNALKMWLDNLGLPQYFDIFVENGFGEGTVELLDLTNEDLKDIGIKKLRHRKLILKQVSNNKQQMVSIEMQRGELNEGEKMLNIDADDSHGGSAENNGTGDEMYEPPLPHTTTQVSPTTVTTANGDYETKDESESESEDDNNELYHKSMVRNVTRGKNVNKSKKVGKNGFYARAVAHYSGSNNDELDMEKDAIFWIVRSVESGWCYGMDGKGLEGWIPSNYLTKLSDNELQNMKPKQKMETDKGYSIFDKLPPKIPPPVMKITTDGSM